MIQIGQAAAECFPLSSIDRSKVMKRPVLYCAQCDVEIQTRHIVWQISRWPSAVDIRALGGSTRCRIGTRLRLRWYADGRLEGPQLGANRWIRYRSISSQHHLYKRLRQTLWLLFGGTPGG